MLVPLWDLSEGEGAFPSWSIDHNEPPALHLCMSRFRLSRSGSATLKPALSQDGVATGALASPFPTNKDESDLQWADAVFLSWKTKENMTVSLSGSVMKE